jgi:tripartite-type tricarboxylate transporter receptor subunit TctC
VARFNELGIIPMGKNPAETAKFLEDEVAKWGKVITQANVKAE